ncbi:MAG TPA: hypothetical protein DIT13_02185 [Verrucomicrobiales bacterium]|nr:hypothetical protein [Verrucomicrobiales bacterium]
MLIKHGKMKFLAVLACAGCILSIPAVLKAKGWQAGAAKTDVTPDFPVRLSGYGSRNSPHEGVSLPIHAKALALRWEADEPVVMLTVDNCGIPAAMRAEVLANVRNAGWKLADERFSLHSSHTHCAPMVNGVLGFLFGADLPPDERKAVDRYTAFLTARMTEVALSALNDLKPAQVDRGAGKAGFAMNRRLKTETGYANSPNFEGVRDHDLPVLRVRDMEGKLRALFTSYACHCTTLAINHIHPDWAGTAQAELELRFPGVVALTAIGCGADQNPFPRREMEHALKHGVTLAKGVIHAINNPMKPLPGPVICRSKDLQLPFDTLPGRAEWEMRTQDKNKWIAHHARHFLGMMERGEKIPDTLPYNVQVWSFGGGLLMIHLPGEVVVDYGLRFKKSFGRQRTWVNAYTNDVPCYIPSQRVWEEGGYEAAGAMTYYGRPTRFASGVEEIIAGAVNELTPQVFKTPGK